MATRIIYGNEAAGHSPKTQVWDATHYDPWGAEYRLPYMERSFISFSWGGRVIEDFGFIATIPNDFLQRNVYADFEDITTQNEVLDGQYFWGSHYTTNTLDVVLATDQIEQRELERFRRWFIPGIARPLILSEHPNRVIYARIASTPSYEFLPIEKQITYKLAGVDVNTSTTLYKGSVSFSFVMDEPHWAANKEILGIDKIDVLDIAGTNIRDPQQDKTYWWLGRQDANDEDGYLGIDLKYLARSNVFNRAGWTEVGKRRYEEDLRDLRKIIIEDGTPYVWQGNDGDILVGNDYILRNCRTRVGLMVAGESGGSEGTWTVHDELTNAIVAENSTDYHLGRVGKLDPVDDISGTGFTLPADATQAFYYPGTTYSFPKLQFKMQPYFGASDSEHATILEPKNDIVYPSTPYNIITLECTEKQQLFLTTPSLWSSYNRAQQLFGRQDLDGTAWPEWRIIIRDNIAHPAVRDWVNKMFDIYEATAGSKYSYEHHRGTLARNLKKMLCAVPAKNADISIQPDGTTAFEATFTIDCKKGEAQGIFEYRKLTLPTDSTKLAWEDFNKYLDSTTYQSIENVGDMIVSNFFRIQERNNPNSDGFIVRWGWPHYQLKANGSIDYSKPFNEGLSSNNVPVESKLYSHRLYHNFTVPLTNVHFTYTTMYL